MVDRMIGAVLAGGDSRRMGRPKSGIAVEGVSLLDRVVDALRAVFDEVVVCGGEMSIPGVPVLADVVPGSGPLGGIATALEAAGGRDVFVAAVDMPLLSPAVVDRLATPPPIRGGVRIARAAGRLQPLCGAYAADLATAAREAASSEDRSVLGFVRRAPVLSLVDVPEDAVANVNTPEELARLLEGLS